MVLLPTSRRHELTEGRLVQVPGEQNCRLQLRQPQIERLAGNPADSHIRTTLNYLLKQVMEKKPLAMSSLYQAESGQLFDTLHFI